MKHADDRGNVITEFAIILPLLLVLIGGVIDWSGAALTGHLLEDASRAGARKAAIARDYTNFQPVVDEVKAHMPNMGFLAGAQVDIAAPANLPDDFTDHLMVKVTISAVYRFSFLGLLGLNEMTIVRNTTARYEWQTAGTTSSYNISNGESTGNHSELITFGDEDFG